MVPMQMKVFVEVFLKRREVLPSSRFLFCRYMTLAVKSDIKTVNVYLTDRSRLTAWTQLMGWMLTRMAQEVHSVHVGAQLTL